MISGGGPHYLVSALVVCVDAATLTAINGFAFDFQKVDAGCYAIEIVKRQCLD